MGEYTSKVPFYTFPAANEAAQREALEVNPLLQRMRGVREKHAADPHRPVYHYVNPEGGLNDPNGLCFWNGYWHLFYQAYPPEDPRQHWGHAISRDLIHWEDLPYCIYPDPEECCFSGAALVAPDRVIAMYHGTKVGNMVAIASDPLLLNWTKVAGRAVIPLSGPGGEALPYRVFDPCIWRKGEYYYSLSGGVERSGPAGKPVAADFLLRSKDLVDWEYLPPFTEDDAFTMVGDDGACPYFWPIGDRHILLFFSHYSGGQYLLGDYDTGRDKFVVTHGAKFNFGAVRPGGVHAPSAAPDGEGNVIVLFNMNPGKETAGWNQIMSLPRKLWLAGPEDLRMAPVDAVKSLRGEHVSVPATELPAGVEVALPGVAGNTLEIELEVDVGGANFVELDVLKSDTEVTRIIYYPDRGYWDRIGGTATRPGLLTLDTTDGSTAADVSTRPPETAPVRSSRAEPLKLRVFIDKSIVEVFAGELQCVATRVYPANPASTAVSIRAQGQRARLVRCDAWQMQSIF